jgi:hypothetical protein
VRSWHPVALVNSRPSSVAADLVDRLERQPSAQLRRVAAGAADLAVMRAQLVDPRVDAALAALRDGAFGKTAERSGVQRLADELDERAWDVQDLEAEGAVSQHEYLVAFGRTRAAASVGFALDSDALIAALESVYEAQAAVADLDAVRVVIGVALG